MAATGATTFCRRHDEQGWNLQSIRLWLGMQSRPAERLGAASGCTSDVTLSMKNSFLVIFKCVVGFAQDLTN
jgi:hypothetical protein